MQSVLDLIPRKGFRKPIPLTVKLQVVLQQDARCTKCNERLGRIDDIEFDHVPALQLRVWDAEAEDTTPRANDAAFIEAKHADCHAKKTFGSHGELARGDVTEIARTKRIAKETDAFRRRMLMKADPSAEGDVPPSRPKKKWPSRPFQKREKQNEAPRSRGSKRGSGPQE